MEVAALVISIISIIITMGLTLLEIYQGIKASETTLVAEYFDELYKDMLVKKIPLSRSKMTFDATGHLVGTEDILSNIKDIRKNSMYFQYEDENFYDILKEELRDLEDYIVHTENKTVIGEDQREVFNKIHTKLSAIYNIMFKKYKGKKIKKIRRTNESLK